MRAAGRAAAQTAGRPFPRWAYRSAPDRRLDVAAQVVIAAGVLFFLLTVASGVRVRALLRSGA